MRTKNVKMTPLTLSSLTTKIAVFAIKRRHCRRTKNLAKTPLHSKRLFSTKKAGFWNSRELPIMTAVIVRRKYVQLPSAIDARQAPPWSLSKLAPMTCRAQRIWGTIIVDSSKKRITVSVFHHRWRAVSNSSMVELLQMIKITIGIIIPLAGRWKTARV